MRIMVVDDSEVARVVIRDILEGDCGITAANICEAEDGRDAMRKYQEFKPDLVFLDIQMPDVDGITAVKVMMRVDPAAKIIMCTASYSAEDVEACIAAGAMDYMLKPPTTEKVLKAVEDVKSGGINLDKELEKDLEDVDFDEFFSAEFSLDDDDLDDLAEDAGDLG